MVGNGPDQLELEAWRQVAAGLQCAVEILDPGGQERQFLRVRHGVGDLVLGRSRIVRRTLRRLVGHTDPARLAAATDAEPLEQGLALHILGGPATPRCAEGYCRIEPRCPECGLSGRCLAARQGGGRPAPRPVPWWERPAEAVGDEEPLAELVGGRRALAVAGELLEHAEGLRGLAMEPLGALQQASGVSPRAARRLRAAFELARRWAGRTLQVGRAYRSAREVHRHLAPLLRDSGQEILLVLLLDGRHRLRRLVEVSRGTLTTSLAHPREIFAPALQHRAGALLLVHNHPSGDPTPSPEDDAITERICAVGDLVGIQVLDHVVIGDVGYVSYLETGRLPAAPPDRSSTVARGGHQR
jgi:DNA repair protein RadC